MNGVFYGVLSLPGNASLDVFRTQMALQEEVEAAVGEQECILQDPGAKAERSNERWSGTDD